MAIEAGIDGINVPDFSGATLSEWKKEIDRLIAEYGKDSVLMMDAGYNNISTYIIKKNPAKRIRAFKKKLDALKKKRGG